MFTENYKHGLFLFIWFNFCDYFVNSYCKRDKSENVFQYILKFKYVPCFTLGSLKVHLGDWPDWSQLWVRGLSFNRPVDRNAKKHLTSHLYRHCQITIHIVYRVLTHLPRGKIVAISQMILFMNEETCILIKISLKFVPKDAIDNETALV